MPRRTSAPGERDGHAPVARIVEVVRCEGLAIGNAFDTGEARCRNAIFRQPSPRGFGARCGQHPVVHRPRSEEHTSELQSLMRNSYAVFCLKTITTTRHVLPHPVMHRTVTNRV